MNKILAILFALMGAGAVALSACSSTTTRNAQASVYGLDTALNTALTGALVYKSLPECKGGDEGLCHEPLVLKQIMAAETAAETALDAAEKVVRDPKAMDSSANAAVAAAQAATASFQTIVDSVHNVTNPK